MTNYKKFVKENSAELRAYGERVREQCRVMAIEIKKQNPGYTDEQYKLASQELYKEMLNS
jgi:hypothetical protein